MQLTWHWWLLLRVQLGVHVQTLLALKRETLAKGPEMGWLTETISSSPVRGSRVTQGSCAKTSATVSCSVYGLGSNHITFIDLNRIYNTFTSHWGFKFL